MIIAVLLFPFGLAVHQRQLRRASRLNSGDMCGRCGTQSEQGEASGTFVIEGVVVCTPCAERQRRRLLVLLPILFLLVVAAGLSTVTGVVFGGMELGWYLNSRMIPLFASVVGFGLLSWGAIKSMKSANLRTLGAASDAAGSVPVSGEKPRLTTDV